MRGLVLLFALIGIETCSAADRPNIILIVADDLGCFELGCYGQKKIQTPHLDAMAKAGARFTQFYAGNAVCAPSRCCLLTGLHPGHAHIRDNREIKPEGQEPLPASVPTLASMLKGQGYATTCIGKWGLGGPETSGDPRRHGFDHFFGYLCQRHAHSHYPKYLWRDGRRVEYPSNDLAKGDQYSHDLFEAEALRFMDENQARPFFLYLPVAVPHMAMQVPDDSLNMYRGKFLDPEYKGGKGYRPHATPRAAYAAMVSRLDRTVGRISGKLKELGIDSRTLMMFTSDNGPTHNVGGADSTFFASAGPLRGLKGDLFEGGIRVPMIAQWPGTIPPDRIIDTPLAFWDVLPTLAQASGAPTPTGGDGLSFLPVMTGKGKQAEHEFLYWEFPGYGSQQAVRIGSWKAVRRQMAKGPIKTQLFDLATDGGEKTDAADRHPDVVRRVEAIMKKEHVRSDLFPLPGVDQP